MTSQWDNNATHNLHHHHDHHIPGAPKNAFFFGHTASTIFLGHYGDAFCTGKCGHICFFSTFRYAFFSTKCWKIMALLCLWLWNQGHIWPYLPIYGHIWPICLVILKVQLRLGLTIFFWSLRVIVVIDEIFCVFVVWPKRLKKTRLRGYRYIYFINTDPWPFHYHFHSSLPASVTSTFYLAKTFCDPKAGQNRSQNSTKAAK